MLNSEEVEEAEKVQANTRREVHDAADADHPVLIEAPPNSKKTTSSYKLVDNKTTPITYLAGRTDLYERAIDWAEDQPDITAKKIPSPHRNCETFSGDKDGDQRKAKQMYSKGVSGAKIHYDEDIYTPCVAGESGCEYMRLRREIATGLESGNIDLLIGNHKHAQNSKYIAGRIVIFDEFNPSPFIQKFPSESDLIVSDHPGEIVSDFLTHLSEHEEDSFPTDTYEDLTDLLLHRDDQNSLGAALDWFEQNGVTRADIRDLSEYGVSAYKHDSSHLLAPFLTLGLLCMRKLGKGIEVAPPPDEYHLPRVHEAWEVSGLQEHHRCVRNRNTGEVFVLTPPDVSPAEQVIGLDALPSKQLWDLVFASGSKFDHRKIIRRQDYSRYLSSALNMTVKQIGDGRYPYAKGKVSKKDKYRFAAIKNLEKERFSLISTKNALRDYDLRNQIGPFVKSAPESLRSDHSRQFSVLNYAKVLSTNIFAEEDLGVVSGLPNPGYEVVRRWAAMCGEEVVLSGNKKPTFKGTAEEVYHHFNQHQVVQAILRFGRHRSVWNDGGSTVYVNTTALPDWFDPDEDLTVEAGTKGTSLIEFLIRAKRTDDKRPMSEQNVNSINENLDINIDESYIHEIMQNLMQEGFISTSDKGSRGILYEWTGDDGLVSLSGAIDKSHLLRIGHKLYLLDV